MSECCGTTAGSETNKKYSRKILPSSRLPGMAECVQPVRCAEQRMRVGGWGAWLNPRSRVLFRIRNHQNETELVSLGDQPFTFILDGGVPLYGNYEELLLVKPCVRLVRQLPTTSFFPPFFFFRSVRHKRPARYPPTENTIDNDAGVPRQRELRG